MIGFTYNIEGTLDYSMDIQMDNHSTGQVQDNVDQDKLIENKKI